jgi:hypothetical protein
MDGLRKCVNLSQGLRASACTAPAEYYALP